MSTIRMRPQDAWWACAAADACLANANGPPPKPVQHVTRLTTKPHLDGRLDDAVWRRVRPIELHSALRDDAEWPAIVFIAADEEFLYVAGHCRKAPDVSYQRTSDRRPRDPDLRTRDRIELYLDIDRDWSTWYRLAIDHRGWVAEDCWGAKSFDPQWFVAADDAADAWSFEAAIPFAELAPQRPTATDAWSAGVHRIVPGQGFQSWSMPATADILPEGFGLFWFE
jgi:hypothetical protein